MKAAIINEFGGPEVFTITQVPTPEINKKDDIKIKVHASSVNPVDWKTRKGNLKFILGSNFPIILGYDVAGEVVEKGKAVYGFNIGDRVYGRLNRKFGGAYAELAVTSASTLAKIPEKLGYEEAASIPLTALTALQGLRDKAKIKTYQEVLIIGATGGIGIFAVQFAKLFGAKVTGISSYRHAELIKKLSPDTFIDYTKNDFKKLDTKYDIIYDTVGADSFLQCHPILKPGGIFVTSLPRPKLIYHWLRSLFTKGKKVRTLLMQSKSADLEFINFLIEQNRFFTYIDKIYTLEEISKAHEYSQTGHAEGKIVIKML